MKLRRHRHTPVGPKAEAKPNGFDTVEMTQALQPAERRVIRLPEVMRRVGLSRSTIWRMVRREEFPIPIPLSMNAQGWFEDEVSAWLFEKATTRASRKAGNR